MGQRCLLRRPFATALPSPFCRACNADRAGVPHARSLRWICQGDGKEGGKAMDSIWVEINQGLRLTGGSGGYSGYKWIQTWIHANGRLEWPDRSLLQP